METNPDLVHYASAIQDHRQWLKQFGEIRCGAWERLLANDSESAIVEACARQWLSLHVEKVEPAEDLSTGGPDFLCQKSGESFYAEVACLERKTVTEDISLQPMPDNKAQCFRPLTRAVFRKCIGKAKQCGGLDAPVLLLIGTMHFQGSEICFNPDFLNDTLTGETYISWKSNLATGELVEGPRNATSLSKASFLAPSKNDAMSFDFVRRSISGVLFCGFGLIPPVVTGILHPRAARPFNSELLAAVKFGRVVEQDGTFSVDWTNG